MLGSRCLLSAAFTTISSKILYRPGTYVTGVGVGVSVGGMVVAVMVVRVRVRGRESMSGHERAQYVGRCRGPWTRGIQYYQYLPGRLTILSRSASYTHIGWVTFSIEPM